jgi:hypothetical protein
VSLLFSTPAALLSAKLPPCSKIFIKYKSLRIVLVLAAKLDLELKQLDITAFLHTSVSETIFVEQPHGFAQGGDRNPSV